jgi:hypothetical protein
LNLLYSPIRVRAKRTTRKTGTTTRWRIHINYPDPIHECFVSGSETKTNFLFGKRGNIIFYVYCMLRKADTIKTS